MTIEEYKQQLRELESNFEVSKRKLCFMFAQTNAKYKTGDIVTDHQGIVKIEKVGWLYDFDHLPQVVYEGTELTKKLVPKKGNPKRRAFEKYIKQ